jgi:catechol 2,3-dioxygenase-like lactoylglutathione lyase family enzyme
VAQPKIESISPFFIVTNVERAIGFYREKLGFEVTFQQPQKNPFMAILSRDGVQIFFKSEEGVSPTPNHQRHKNMRWDAFFYTSEPDALAAELSKRGATFSRPLSNTHDGLRGFEILDPDGYTMFLGRTA